MCLCVVSNRMVTIHNTKIIMCCCVWLHAADCVAITSITSITILAL